MRNLSRHCQRRLFTQELDYRDEKPRDRFAFLALQFATLACAAEVANARSPADANIIAREREAGRSLKVQLTTALGQKSPRFVIPAGRYRLSPESPNLPHLVFKNISNFELIGDGVTLICETKNSAIFIQHCNHLKIKGVTIDYDPLPMTQGTIKALTKKSLDFKIDAGYDAPDYDGKGVGHIWIADAVTRQVKPGSINYGGAHKEIINLGNNMYRLVMRGERHDTVQPGDHIKIPQRLNLKAPHGVYVNASKNIDLQDVTIESAPCFGFVSTWGDSISLDNVRVIPGPPPPGATEPRIFSSSADGINFQSDSHGPVIRNCMVASNGDDGIAIYNNPDLVLSSGKKASVFVGLGLADPNTETYSPGDTLRFFHSGPAGPRRERLYLSSPQRFPRAGMERPTKSWKKLGRTDSKELSE